jgi:hypothetical protein
MSRLPILLAVIAIASACPAQAQDRSWSIERETASPIDGKRTLLVSTKHGETVVSLGCNLGGTFVTVGFGRALLPASPRLPGRYRIDQQPPADVTWDGSASDAAIVREDPAKALIRALARGAIWHIRVGETERSIDVRGLSAYEARLKEACGL